MKTSEGLMEAFEIYIGGILGPNAQSNEKLKGRIPAEQVGPVLADLITFFKNNLSEKESFHQFFKLIGVLPFQKELDEILFASKK